MPEWRGLDWMKRRVLKNKNTMRNKKGILFLFSILLVAGFLNCQKNAAASEVLVSWTFSKDSNLADGGNTVNINSKAITVAGGTSTPSFNSSGATTYSARATGWQDGASGKYWEVEFSAEGYEVLRVFSKQRSSSTGPRDFRLQYKVGDKGMWEDAPEAAIAAADNFTSGVLNGVYLPTKCDNQETVRLRWIMSSNSAVNGGNVSSLGASRIDDIIIVGDLTIKELHGDFEFLAGTNQIEKKSAYGGLVISEIMYDPEGSNSSHAKWAEMVNLSEQTIVIGSSQTSYGWKIKDLKIFDSSNHYLYASGGDPIEIRPGGFLVVANSPDNFAKDYPDREDIFVLKSAITLTNSAGLGNLVLYDNDYALDSVAFSKQWGALNNGKSLEKIDLSAKNQSENWRESCVPGGTPGRENSLFEECLEYSKEKNTESDFENYGRGIRLNEILPNPKGDKKTDSFIELRNGEDFDINLAGWVLKNNSKTAKFVFPEQFVLKSGEYLAIYRDIFKFALKTSDIISLLDPDGGTVSSITYAGAKKDIAYGFDGTDWRWSRFLTPGEMNKFSKKLKIKIKKTKETYAGMPVDFSVEVGGVKAKDEANLKYRWDFGDGRKSYLKSKKHIYEKKGKYKVIVSVDDGIEKATEELKVKVANYPEFKVEIAGLSPNADGLGEEREWIEIKNNSAKKVNLKNWKIATGPKKPVNHSVFADFEINAGESRRITREYSLFSLNKKGTRVELRYPNGKKADAVFYVKNKIEKDEMYRKINGRWVWEKTNPDASEGGIKNMDRENNGAAESLEQNPDAENRETDRAGEDDSESEKSIQVLGASTSEQDDDEAEENSSNAAPAVSGKSWPVGALVKMRDFSNYFFNQLILIFG